MIGQLYLVRTRGRFKDSGDIEKCTYIVSAADKDECEMKARYFIDLSEYSEFALKSIERVKPNFHMVTRKVLASKEWEASKDTTDQMDKSDDSTSSHIEHPTLQASNKNVFAFGVTGHIVADDEGKAMLRVSKFLARRSMDSNVRMPFCANGHLIVEALGESDNTKRADLERDAVYDEPARIVSGGAASPR